MPRHIQLLIAVCSALSSALCPAFFGQDLGASEFAADQQALAAQQAPMERMLMESMERAIQSAAVAPETPDITTTSDGAKILAWSQLGGSGTVICIRYVGEDDLNRTPALGASEFGVVNDQPSIAADDRGNVGIFWRQSEGTALKLADGSVVTLDGDAIVGRFFNNAETLQTTGDIVISDTSPNSEAPQATTDKNGNTVVTWQEGDVIRGRRLGGDRLVGPAFDVNDTFTSSARNTVIDSAASGEFVAAWTEERSGRGVRARRYDASGGRRGSLITVTSSPAASTPQIAVADNGSFTVVWEQSGDIFTRLYNANGTPRGSEFVANQNRAGTQRKPAVDANADGDFVVIWESDVSAKGAALQTGDLVGRFFNPVGEAETDDFVVAEEDVATAPQDPKVTIDDRDTVTVVFDRRDNAGMPQGLFRKEFRTQAPPAPCVADATTLCLNGDRFRVISSFETNSGSAGSGQATRLTEDTGFFTFFDAANIEVVVKVLEGCPINGNYWVFASGLTDVEVDLRVEDTETGQTVAYFNRGSSAFTPVQDTSAFATCGAKTNRETTLSADVETQLTQSVSNWLDEVASNGGSPRSIGSALACSGDDEVLCLTGGRFSVTSTFRIPNGTNGIGQAVALTPDTGYFWFFDEANVEVVVKVLDACGVNGNYWVFAGGLTDVRVDLEVTDTDQNRVRSYRNPQGTPFQTITDTGAFSTCP